MQEMRGQIVLPIVLVIPNAACLEVIYATFPGIAAKDNADVTLTITPLSGCLVPPSGILNVRGSCFSMTLMTAREMSRVGCLGVGGHHSVVVVHVVVGNGFV